MMFLGRSFIAFTVVAAAGVLAAPAAYSQESNQPYIDQRKRELQEQDAEDAEDGEPPEAGSYIERRQKELGPPPEQGSYIDREKKRIREEGPAEEAPYVSEEAYIERRKKELGPLATPRSAIQELKEGRSELKAEKNMDVNFAAGFKVGANRSVGITSGSSARPFAEVYGTNWNPDITFFGEWQPVHSEWFGSLGLVAGVGVSRYKGTGTFELELKDPKTNEAFPAESRTNFEFFTLPVSVGVNYRLNLFRILRPFVQVLPTAIGYWESRSDEKKGHRGYSIGSIFSGGVALNMDWFSKAMSWDIYAASGIKRTLLTVEYQQMLSFSGGVSVDVSGVFAGFTFEY